MSGTEQDPDQMISTADLAEVAAGIRRFLAAIERTELSAPTGLITRMEGAAEALEAVLAYQPPESPAG